jgi:hypothetical protein
MQTGIFPLHRKPAHISLLLKKPGLDIDIAGSYRPISNSSCISKPVEGVVARRFRAHEHNFDLFPPKLSAYRAYH